MTSPSDDRLPPRLLDALDYDELRAIAGRIARSGRLPEHDATSLLHEALANWMSRSGGAPPASREAAIAQMVAVIRNAAVDRRRRAGRASHARPIDPALLDAVHGPPPRDGAFDEDAFERALGELRARSPRAAAALELRVHGGLELTAVADALRISLAQAKRDLAVAKAFIRTRLEAGGAGP